jgi:hypothetical protein
MPRLAVAIAPGVGLIQGVLGSPVQVGTLIGDRIANGDAFPGETWIRLPKRLTVSFGMLTEVSPRHYPRRRNRKAAPSRFRCRCGACACVLEEHGGAAECPNHGPAEQSCPLHDGGRA